MQLSFYITVEERPFVVVSTHFHSLRNLLQPLEDSINYRTFLFDKQGHEMIYLYKAVPGAVAHSEANSVAKKAGIDEKILERSSDILKCIAQGGNLTMNLRNLSCDFQTLTKVIDAFQLTELNEENLPQIFSVIDNIFSVEQN